jgi:hypothetical protein
MINKKYFRAKFYGKNFAQNANPRKMAITSEIHGKFFPTTFFVCAFLVSRCLPNFIKIGAKLRRLEVFEKKRRISGKSFSARMCRCDYMENKVDSAKTTPLGFYLKQPKGTARLLRDGEVNDYVFYSNFAG